MSGLVEFSKSVYGVEKGLPSALRTSNGSKFSGSYRNIYDAAKKGSSDPRKVAQYKYVMRRLRDTEYGQRAGKKIAGLERMGANTSREKDIAAYYHTSRTKNALRAIPTRGRLP